MNGLTCSRDATVVARGETLSAHSVRPRKMPGWIASVQEIFCKQTVILVGFLPSFCFACYIQRVSNLVLFHLIHFGFQVFHPEKLKRVIEGEENLVVNNKDNRVFLSRSYRSDSCPLEI